MRTYKFRFQSFKNVAHIIGLHFSKVHTQIMQYNVTTIKKVKFKNSKFIKFKIYKILIILNTEGSNNIIKIIQKSILYQ